VVRADDPWVEHERTQAHKLAAISLAHRLDDVLHSARAVATNRLGCTSMDAIWQATAADSAQDDIDEVVARLEMLRDHVWSSLG